MSHASTNTLIYTNHKTACPDQPTSTLMSRLNAPLNSRLIYLPAYNCSKTIVSTLKEIPESLLLGTRLLVVDNSSSDGTSEIAASYLKKSPWSGKATVVRTHHNLGYAGSQKLAFRLACAEEQITQVVMLHGDGQYPPHLLPTFFAALDSSADVAYGYRSQSLFGALEETPSKVRLAIATLNAMERFLTGCLNVKEWHSGYVGYRTEFLRELNLSAITNTRHIDGNLLFAASKLGKRVEALPIYKRYRSFEGFHGRAAYLYILHCLFLMVTMRFTLASLRSNDTSQASHPQDTTAVLTALQE